MSTKILILCPHNAAKSVVAGAYLRRVAEARGLNLEVNTAGTEPDAHVLPLVREQLESDGYPVTSTPRLLTADDLTWADRVVNIGCVLAHLPRHDAVEHWGIPNFSEDPSAAFAALSEHVDRLATSIADLHT